MQRANKYLFTSLVIIILSSFNLAGQNKKAKASLIAEIDSILQTEIDTEAIPGAVIEIKTGHDVIYKHAYGYAQKYNFAHDPVNEKMSVRHLFDIASLTKVIGTTTSIMLLADRGLLSVDDPVYKYIKAFNTTEKSQITIRHLLTHTAGLYEWYPLYYRASDKMECYHLIESLSLKYPVGEQRKYSDLGYVLLGEIIEIVSHLPLDQFMTENIFLPLKMKNTAYNPLKYNFKKIAATSHGNPYEKRMVYDSTLGFKISYINPEEWNGWRSYTLKGEVNDGNAWYANGGISGAAGLFSSVKDLQKLTDMMLNKGKVKSRQFISEKTIKSFLTSDSFNNGLGWIMDPENSFMHNAPAGAYGHTGFTGTSIVAIPSYRTSVILLINRQNTGLSENGEYYNVSPIRSKIFLSLLKYLESRD